MEALEQIKSSKMPVVGMGRKVQRELKRNKIFHYEMTHPAARGSIRLKENYQQHVAKVLTQIHEECHLDLEYAEKEFTWEEV